MGNHSLDTSCIQHHHVRNPLLSCSGQSLFVSVVIAAVLAILLLPRASVPSTVPRASVPSTVPRASVPSTVPRASVPSTVPRDLTSTSALSRFVPVLSRTICSPLKPKNLLRTSKMLKHSPVGYRT